MKYRGHDIEQINGQWVYADTGQPIPDKKDRACGYCCKSNTPEGYDGCIGKLDGPVINACCGHGILADAYVQPVIGEALRGEDAKQYFRQDLVNKEIESPKLTKTSAEHVWGSDAATIEELSRAVLDRKRKDPHIQMLIIKEEVFHRLAAEAIQWYKDNGLEHEQRVFLHGVEIQSMNDTPKPMQKYRIEKGGRVYFLAMRFTDYQLVQRDIYHYDTFFIKIDGNSGTRIDPTLVREANGYWLIGGRKYSLEEIL